VITFRCGKCAQPVQAPERLTGQAVKCQRCGHLNICPPPTVSFKAAPATPGPAPASGGGLSLRTLGIAAGVVLFALTIWMAWAQFDGPGETVAANAASPAEALQQELLKQNIDKPGDPALEAMYAGISAEHFSGNLPSLHVMWEPGLERVGPLSGEGFTLEGMFGHRGRKSVILLNPELRDDPAALMRALCHEAVHAYLYATNDRGPEHGPAFQAVLKRLSNENAFEGIVSTDQERITLRAWLDDESKRLDEESRYMDGLAKEMEQERAEIDRATAEFDAGGRPSEAKIALVNKLRDAYNEKVTDANARTEQDRADLEHFNEEVARYNLMLVYPDGMDAGGRVAPKATPPGNGGE
jgi:hypothetical protein